MIKNNFKPEIFVGMSVGNTISLESILKASCKRTGVTTEQAISKTRFDKTPYARQLYCYVAANYNQKTLKEIGKLINCDHSTIIASRNKIQNQIGIYDDVEQDVSFIKSSVCFESQNAIAAENDANTVGYHNTPERMRSLRQKTKNDDWKKKNNWDK